MENLKDKIINQLQKYKKSNITLDEIVPSTIYELNTYINELINEEVEKAKMTEER